MRCAVSSSSVKECAPRARSTHGVHHAIVEVNIVIGVVLGEVLVARVVPLVVDAVIGLTLGLIAHVVIVVFVVAILHRIFLCGRYTLYMNCHILSNVWPQGIFGGHMDTTFRHAVNGHMWSYGLPPFFCLAFVRARLGQLCEYGIGRPAERWRVKGGSPNLVVAALVSVSNAENITIDFESAMAAYLPSVFGGLMSPHTSAHSPGTPPGPHNGVGPCWIGRLIRIPFLMRCGF